MNKELYVCTDPDCAQYCRRINDYVFLYIQASEVASGQSYAVHSAVVDLREYTLDELWSYCSGYYDSFEQMVEQYGFRDALNVMAECVFEQLPFYEMEFVAEKQSFEAATAYIYEWIEKHGGQDFR